MSKRDNLLLVDDIVVSFQAILKYTNGMTYPDFINNQMCIDAVIRNFEIIGEAANFISKDFKELHPEIEWRKLTDFRNRLIHHYFGVSYDIVWEIISSELTDYLTYLEDILK